MKVKIDSKEYLCTSATLEKHELGVYVKLNEVGTEILDVTASNTTMDVRSGTVQIFDGDKLVDEYGGKSTPKKAVKKKAVKKKAAGG